VEDVSSWSRDAASNFKYPISKQREKIYELRKSLNDGSEPQLESMQKNLVSLLLQEETYWRQR